MSRELARAVSTAGSAASDDACAPLLQGACYHSVGAFLALNKRHSRKVALSQSCYFASRSL